MNPNPPSSPPAEKDPVAAREVRLTALLVTGALVAGAALQAVVPPGALTLVAGSVLAGAVVLAFALLVPGRLRATIAGFRFTSTLLVALSIFAVVGTLILQGKPAAFYQQRYGPVAPFILGLRLDDVFHGLPFAGLMALFGAAVIASATLRWPVKLRNAGFFVCHVGLIASIGGAAASAALSIRGRIDLHAGGESATHVRVTKAGRDVGRFTPLGFELQLDRFDLVNYETEYRVGYYEQEIVHHDHGTHPEWTLKASFDPDDAKHRLPSGASFRLAGAWPDYAPRAVAVPVASGGTPALQATLDGEPRWLFPGEIVRSRDGTLAVAFGVERPAPPEGVLTAVLVSSGERKVVVHRADGAAELPWSDGLAILGGAVKLGALLPQAQRTVEHATASLEWKSPAVLLQVTDGGKPMEKLLRADPPDGLFLDAGRALVFEKRNQEVKAFLSTVTATQGPVTLASRQLVSVNEPLTVDGWTLYQVNYNPDDPSYSGLEAVYDPGVPYVFGGFALISLGVFLMFYVEPRLKRKNATPAARDDAPAQAA